MQKGSRQEIKNGIIEAKYLFLIARDSASTRAQNGGRALTFSRVAAAPAYQQALGKQGEAHACTHVSAPGTESRVGSRGRPRQGAAAASGSHSGPVSEPQDGQVHGCAQSRRAVPPTKCNPTRAVFTPFSHAIGFQARRASTLRSRPSAEAQAPGSPPVRPPGSAHRGAAPQRLPRTRVAPSQSHGPGVARRTRVWVHKPRAQRT